MVVGKDAGHAKAGQHWVFFELLKQMLTSEALNVADERSSAMSVVQLVANV